LKKAVWIMTAVVVIGVGSALWYAYNQNRASQAALTDTTSPQQSGANHTSAKKETVQQQPKSGSADASNIQLPWLTKAHVSQGKLDDEEIGIGTTAAELTAALGKPDRIDNYEGVYYGYQDAAFFFPRSVADEIEDSDPIVKMVLNVEEHELTRSFLNHRFGQPVDEGLMESTGDYLIFYNVGKYTLAASPDDGDKNKIIGLELSPSEK